MSVGSSSVSLCVCDRETVMLGTQMGELKMIRVVLHCHWAGTHRFNYQVQQTHKEILETQIYANRHTSTLIDKFKQILRYTQAY